MQVGLQGTGQNQGTGGRVEQAIRTGSTATGVSYDYLARTAYRESSYRTDLTMTTSSATGLYQFLDQTWLGLVKTEGPGVGLGAAADAITRDKTGRYDVSDPTTKQRILDLRKDATVSAVMAGKFTQQNQASMTAALGRTPSSGELYAGHVLGSAGGSKLIQLVNSSPNAAAADYFPEAAGSNRAMFYQANGTPKSVADVYGFLTRDGDVPAPAASSAPTVVSGLRPSPQALNQLSTIIQAQSAGNAAQEPLGFSTTGSPSEVRRSLDTSVAQLSLPGDTSKAVTEAGGKLSGWRAKRANDAFSTLMRSDAADLSAEPPLDIVALGKSGVAPTISKVLPGLSGMAGASGFAPLGQHGGSASAAEALASGSAAATSSTANGTDGARRSRILTDAMRGAARGAPAQPLPMVTDTLGVARPSRFSAAAYVAANPTPVVSGQGATSGRGGLPLSALSFAASTEAVAPLATSAVPTAANAALGGGLPLLPPMPGETSTGPLDLVAASRGRVL